MCWMVVHGEGLWGWMEQGSCSGEACHPWGLGHAITWKLIYIHFEHHLGCRPWMGLSCVALGRLLYLSEPWILPLESRVSEDKVRPSASA